MRRSQENSSRKDSAPGKQKGSFQMFDLKEVRAEEQEAEERALALEREEARKKSEALKERMAFMETSYSRRESRRETHYSSSSASAARPARRRTVQANAKKEAAVLQEQQPRLQTEDPAVRETADIQETASAGEAAAAIEKAAVPESLHREAAEKKTQTRSREEREAAAAKRRRQTQKSRRTTGKRQAAGSAGSASVNFRNTAASVNTVRSEADKAQYAALNKTMDSSRNFSSVHQAARQIQQENSARRSAPKAELRGMDDFWKEMAEAKQREEEEKRQREIARAKQQELDKARTQESVIARMREEEAQRRREEEAKKQEELEIQRRNEEAAEKWQAEEAARVKAETEKMRELQAKRMREEEARRIQEKEIKKVREAQVTQVQKEQEENIRRELARLRKEEEQHSQIENMLEKSASEYEEEGAILKNAEDAEALRRETLEKETLYSGEVPEKEPDDLEHLFDDGFDEEDEYDGEISFPPENSGYIRVQNKKTYTEEISDEDLFDQEEEPEVDSGDDEYEEPVDKELPEEELFDEDTDEEVMDEEDDFDEDIPFPSEKKSSKRNSSQAFVLPSFGEIMEAERPKDTRKFRDTVSRNREIYQQAPKTLQKIDDRKAAYESPGAEVKELYARSSGEEEKKEESAETAEEVQEVPNAVLTEETCEVSDVRSAKEQPEEAASEPAEERQKELTPEASEERQETIAVEAEEASGAYAEEKQNIIPAQSKDTHTAVNQKEHPRKVFNRKKYDSMLGKVVAASLAAVMALNIIIPDRDSSEIENRELNQIPALTLSSVMDGSYADKVEDWQTDQFIGRNVLRNMNTFLSWLGGNREENDVYYGKNGQLLEKIVSADAESLQSTVDTLNAFAAAYPDVRYGMMLVPDAGTILSSSYPAFAETKDQRGDFGTVKNLLSQQYLWVDALAAMDTHAEEKLYYKTDHHWTSLGAYYGYQEVCSTLGLQSASFTANQVSSSFNGVLSSTSGYCLGEKETIEIYTPEPDVSVLVTNIEDGTQTASLYDKDKLKTKDQYAVFLGGNYPVLDIKTTTENDEVLLLFKDSFANSLVPFLAANYKEIVMVDPRYYNGDIQEIMLTCGISDVLFLYSGNTFSSDQNLQSVLSLE